MGQDQKVVTKKTLASSNNCVQLIRWTLCTLASTSLLRWSHLTLTGSGNVHKQNTINSIMEHSPATGYISSWLCERSISFYFVVYAIILDNKTTIIIIFMTYTPGTNAS